MRRNILIGLSALALLVPAGQTAAESYKAPRNAFGQPDMSGLWTNASITQLERPAGVTSLVISEAAAKTMEQAAARLFRDDAPSDPKAPAPTADQDPGGYNTFWMDPGTHVARLGTELRSSWIVDPPDGKLPWSPAGRAMFVSAIRHMQSDFDGPEGRQVAERCLLGFGSTAGPPMLNNLYNNTYQIQQTRDAVVILVEMDHDARIIRLSDRRRLPAGIATWMGESLGRWEGDTLVVETVGFRPEEALRPGIPTTIYISPEAKVTERFTRISPTQIKYEFVVDDPKTYATPWRGEMPFNTTKGPMYEYACHEGNYALPGILRGARVTEPAK